MKPEREIGKIDLPGVAYMAFSGASSFNIGAYLVLTSWSAVELTGDARLVSSLFLMALILGMFLANFAGVVTDGSRTRRTLVLANSARIIAAFILWMSFSTDSFVALSLYIFTAIRVLGNSFLLTAGSIAFQEIFPKPVRPKRVAENGIIRQVGIAVGTGLTGLMVVWLGGGITALILMFVTVIQTPLILIFSRTNATIEIELPSTKQSMYSRWIEGFSYLDKNSGLFISMVVLSATYSIAQLTNVMVPVFVMNDLGRDANVYATMEMLWAVGGTLILLIARRIQSEDVSILSSLVLLAGTGIVMIAFAMVRQIEISFVLYFLLGGLFCITRMMSDTRILLETEIAYIGRVRAANLLLTNTIGAAIFALPWLVSTDNVTMIYISWGAFLIVIALFALVFLRKTKISKMEKSL